MVVARYVFLAYFGCTLFGSKDLKGTLRSVSLARMRTAGALHSTPTVAAALKGYGMVW